MAKLTTKEKKELKAKLRERYGTKCHYCLIEEQEFKNIWGENFYRLGKRGRTLEIDHKDGNKENWDTKNLVLACALCNMAKSDRFRYDEFKMMGDVIRTIWQKRLVKLKEEHEK